MILEISSIIFCFCFMKNEVEKENNTSLGGIPLYLPLLAGNKVEDIRQIHERPGVAKSTSYINSHFCSTASLRGKVF